MTETVETTKTPTSIFALFGTDRDAEESGKWFDFGPDIKIKIRRFKSQHSNRTRERLEKPYDRLRKSGNLPVDIMEKVIHRTLAESIVVDWKGLFDRDGKPMPFSADAVDALLLELPELRDSITSISLSMDNYRTEDDKKTEGNS